MQLPRVALGPHQVSRLICGGNPFSYFSSHAGELTYVSRLFQAYLTMDKIVETLMLCEKHGINTFLARGDDHIFNVLDQFERKAGHRIQWIAQLAPERQPYEKNLREIAERRPIAVVVHGGVSDRHYAEGAMGKVKGLVKFIHDLGLTAGVGAHNPYSIRAAEDIGAAADFYFLTMNPVKYHCADMNLAKMVCKSIPKPFIGFKVLGAGRCKPEVGFKCAMDAGAEFLAVGMFDFQVAENAALAAKLYAELGAAAKS